VKFSSVSLAALLFALGASAAAAQSTAQTTARAIHDAATVLDTHFDTPANFGREGWSMMDRHDHAADGSQVDYPRMVEGGVDGGFFVIFTQQGPRTPDGHAKARDAALLRASEIREMVARHDDKFALATRAEEAAAINAQGKRFVYMSVENSYPLGQDLTLMQTFHDLGVRMIGPIHFANNDLGDSATDPKGPEWGGLSPLGKQFVAEANRLGMLLDASHASDAATEQMIELSAAPIILSHSGVDGVFDHPRNIPDDLLKKVAAKGGVIQINAFSNYMVSIPKIPERDAALAELVKSIGAAPRDMTDAQRDAYLQGRRTIDAKWPLPRADLDDFMAHMLHAIKVAGVDHVGVSGDFDGGGGIDGLEDVTDFPSVTERLVAAGFTQADIDKIWGGNALRVLKAAEAAKAN
jgi:membrane dipeptidase